MLTIEHHIFPSDLDEAARILTENPASQVLGSCGYIRLGDRTITTAIDLSQLGLDTIVDTGDAIEIGAMASLRAIETHPLCCSLFSGVLPASVASIVGVQFRNCATIGGTVAGRLAFSDPLTALLALNARLRFQLAGEMTLEEYLPGKAMRDILTHILIPTTGQAAAFSSVRRSATDYAVLNTAVARSGEQWRIVVGARPGRAALVPEAAQYLQDNGLDEQSAAAVGELAASHLQFGDNPRASATYRRAVCPVLVRRNLLEIYHAH